MKAFTRALLLLGLALAPLAARAENLAVVTLELGENVPLPVRATPPSPFSTVPASRPPSPADSCASITCGIA